jgi:hypothetical protein
MPTISMFYGILVALMYEDNERHHLPHFHVRYQNFKASIAIDDGRVLAGSFPPKQLKLVQAWVNCIGTSCWQIGNWRAMAKSPSVLHLCSKVGVCDE